ncbi:MAG: NAD(P)H-binding protein [Bacteroidota bacterium]
MNVLLIGASGFTGKVVLQSLLSQGHQVTAVTRDLSSLKSHQKGLRILLGNVLDADFITKALKNQDAVINCLGIGGKGNAKPNSLVSDAMEILVSAMEKAKVKRLIAMSNVGAGNSRAFQPWYFTNIILPLFMKWLQVIIEDKNKMEPLIMNSQLDWTIVRCPNIVDQPAKHTLHATIDGKGLGFSVTNRDVAAFMVDQINRTDFLHQAPCVSN